ncbi:MAG: helix-turn-helix domain-containing protein [Bacteroidota bacterium]
MMDLGNKSEVICLESKAFYILMENVINRFKHHHEKEHDKWINDEEAMHLLRIKSRTTLQKLRDEGRIRYSQPTRKLILYDRDSLLEYLDFHAKDTF